jgi:UDP-N-acetylglucosamine 2-epimerase (non-hydrolysing)
MLIDLIVGARPNYPKVAAIVRAIESVPSYKDRLEYRLINTGQHHDFNMSSLFAEQLEMPPFDIELKATGNNSSQLTASIIQAYSSELSKSCPSVVIVVGDVTSTLACALVAKQHGVRLVHVEAGLRSRDRTMPEELNRMVTDVLSDILYATSEQAAINLNRADFLSENVVVVGNTMVDTLLHFRSKQRPPAFWDGTLSTNGYLLFTLHRPANVDDTQKLLDICHDVCLEAHMPVIWPVHPRIANSILGQQLPSNLTTVPPQGYLEFLFLLDNCLAVVTDSGGVSEEATVLSKPCLVIRNTTERIETIEAGSAELINPDSNELKGALNKVVSNTWKSGTLPALWDGKAAERIVKHLQSVLLNN